MSTMIEIPLSKLVPSAANVRRTGPERGVEELAASIAALGLLQSLAVRPARDAAGQATGKYEVVAGGRRLAALRLLAKRKALAKSASVPCLVRDECRSEEASLAENVVREALHPADQFEAFRRLHEEHGLGAEEIAARFGVTSAVVRQRLRLGAASPALMGLYREGTINLDQLMAFCLTDDHARQEQVWAALTWNKDPAIIRRLLTESQIPARDRRAVFVGAEAYEAAGGVIVRDLFAEDGGGWLADLALLDRLVMAKLEAAAETVAAEGWKWVQAVAEFPYAATAGMRRVCERTVPLSEAERVRLDELSFEFDTLAASHEGEVSEDIAGRLADLEAAMAELSERERVFDPTEVARAGAFVTIGHDGNLRIERSFVRREDEPPREPEAVEPEAEDAASETYTIVATSTDEEEPEDARAPLSDRLVAELTAHRTAALREALAGDPETALRAVVHALELRAFRPRCDPASCLEITAESAVLRGLAPGIEEAPAARAMAERHERWAARLPRDPGELWAWLGTLDRGELLQLLAYVAGRTVNAVQAPYDRRPRALAHAAQLAEAVALDMAASWQPTVAGYLGRVTKARILEAVREGVSPEAAERIARAKKPAMAEEAERLLAGSGWLPPLLRTAGAARNEADEMATYAAAAE